ncbi:MAG TPA: methyltransferase domain-containing protein, partial [bacterium]
KPLYEMSPDEIRAAVAEKYNQVATLPTAKFNFPVGREFAESVGYDPAILDSLPVSMSDSFTGAGNPQPFVDPKSGETIIDLGCGAGLDLYFYSQKVGGTGKVYGIDHSSEMIDKARKNMEALKIENVELICASVDKIPLPDSSVDLLTANGIYNLCPDKESVMREAARLIKHGGRTIFAEITLTRKFEQEIRLEIKDWFRCIGGAFLHTDFLSLLQKSGFRDPEILWSGRNKRTFHELAVSNVIRAFR